MVDSSDNKLPFQAFHSPYFTFTQILSAFPQNCCFPHLVFSLFRRNPPFLEFGKIWNLSYINPNNRSNQPTSNNWLSKVDF